MRFIIYIILIAIAAWVYSDATKRGKSSTDAALWAAGAFLLLIIVLPIWLITRPKIVKHNDDPIPESMREKRTVYEELDNLARLRQEGAISEEQYHSMKSDILKKQSA